MTEATVIFEPAPSMVSEMKTDLLPAASLIAIPRVAAAGPRTSLTTHVHTAAHILLVLIMRRVSTTATFSVSLLVPPLASLDVMTEAAVIFEPAPAIVTEVEARFLATTTTTSLVVKPRLHVVLCLVNKDYYNN